MILHSSQKNNPWHLPNQQAQGVDQAVDLVAGYKPEESLKPEEGRRIRAKVDWVILPLLFAIYISKSLRRTSG